MHVWPLISTMGQRLCNKMVPPSFIGTREGVKNKPRWGNDRPSGREEEANSVSLLGESMDCKEKEMGTVEKYK